MEQHTTAIPAMRFLQYVFGELSVMCIRQYSSAMCLRECASGNILWQYVYGNVYPAAFFGNALPGMCIRQHTFSIALPEMCIRQQTLVAAFPVIWRYPFFEAISVYPATHFRQHTSESESKQKSKKQHMRRIEQIKPALHQNAPAKMLWRALFSVV